MMKSIPAATGARFLDILERRSDDESQKLSRLRRHPMATGRAGPRAAPTGV